jgi:Zn-dependent protease with chaperone function
MARDRGGAEADAFAARHAAPQALARALEKLTRTNATTLTPGPLTAALQHGHPSLARREAASGA